MAKDKNESFMYTDSEINILKNFASINPSMIMSKSGLKVMGDSKGLIGVYPFEKEYSYETYGIYETGEFLTALGAMNSPLITLGEKSLLISDGEANLRYFTTATELLPNVPDLATKFEGIDCDLVFNLSADKLAFLLKMANILKSKYLFFESDKKKVRITAGDVLSNSSSNNYTVDISEGITTNKLVGAVKITLEDFKIMTGAYQVSLSSKISRWVGTNGVIYYCANSTDTKKD